MPLPTAPMQAEQRKLPDMFKKSGLLSVATMFSEQSIPLDILSFDEMSESGVRGGDGAGMR